MKYCTKCGSQVSDSDKFCSDCGKATGQPSNVETVKVELVNTNKDKAIKAVGDSISIGKKVAKKHKEATLDFLEIGGAIVIGIIVFFGLMAVVILAF